MFGPDYCCPVNSLYQAFTAVKSIPHELQAVFIQECWCKCRGVQGLRSAGGISRPLRCRKEEYNKM